MLHSELNWPLGAKEPLDFTRSRMGNGFRWSIPSHLLDAIFSCCGIPIIADIADSKVASKLHPCPIPAYLPALGLLYTLCVLVLC